MDATQKRNLLAALQTPVNDEVFEHLLAGNQFRLERIVSAGHTTPAGKWYDQDRDEWVLLLAGRARLGFEEGLSLELVPGDCVNIPANRRHRVEWTDPGQETVWLALHYNGDDAF